MDKIILVTLISLLSLAGWAGVIGEGKFFSLDDDSIAFVKQQLLIDAYHNVIDKEMKDMGLDTELFWKKFNARFEAQIAISEKKIREKNGVKEGETPNEAVNKELRENRANLLNRFIDVKSIITAYTIKQMTRSSSNPNSRYIEIEADVNRKALTNFFYKFTVEAAHNHYKILLVVPRLQLNGMLWTDLGIDKTDDFEQSLINHWSKWFSENWGSFFDEIVVFKITQDEMTTNKIISENVDGVTLRLNFSILKLDEIASIKRQSLSIKGEFLLVENRHEVLLSDGSSKEVKFKITLDKRIRAASDVASSVYSLLLADLSDQKKAFSEKGGVLQSESVEVNSGVTLIEAQDLAKLFTAKMIPIRADCSLISVINGTAKFKINLKESGGTLYQNLAELNGKTISSGRAISVNVDSKTVTLK